jgi:hypothetical protein
MRGRELRLLFEAMRDQRGEAGVQRHLGQRLLEQGYLVSGKVAHQLGRRQERKRVAGFGSAMGADECEQILKIVLAHGETLPGELRARNLV